MERFHAHVGSRNPTLEKRPEILKSVSVYAAIHVLSGVVNYLMRVIACESFIREQRISVESRASSHMLAYFFLQNFLATARNHAGANLSATLQYADNGGFVFGSSSSNAPLALTDVHVPRFAADESFIHFDFSGEFATKEIILHGKPDAMKHEPRRLLSYFDIPRNLVTADSIFAVSDQPSSSEPFIQRNRGIFHHGADLDGKLALRMMLSTSPSAPLIAEFDSLATASWANDFAVRPAADSK